MNNRLLPLIKKLWRQLKAPIEMMAKFLNKTKIKYNRHHSIVKFIATFVVALIAITSIALYGMAPSGALTRAYTDPTQLTSIPFGAHSHWLQPWRSYLDTVRATRFLNGTGVQWNVSNSANQELVAAMLAKHGIHQARVEIGWGKIDYDDESKLIPQTAKELRATLLAFKKYGIRPRILLNANQGAPCPVKVFQVTATDYAGPGDKGIQVEDASRLVVNHSGLSNLTDYWAAESLITNIDENNITLSKPLPNEIQVGDHISIATLKYRPFEPPGTNDYKATIAGWQRYVGTVAKFASGVLGTTQSADKGFDMEIWNELSFASNFLYINSYYDSSGSYEYDEESIYNNLVQATAAYVNAHPTDFQGVRLGNGFANTIPWPTASQQPGRIFALDKHPYRDREKYPRDQSQELQINALGQEDSSNFVPTYSTLFPEYYATGLTGATIVRDMGPITTDVNGDKHGRNSRVINGKVVPTYTWITEVNINPRANDGNITTERALAVKAKTTARYFSFFLNKGATQVDLFAAAGGNKEWAIVKQNFLDYAEGNNVYPTDDSSYTSPALATVGRMVSKMSQQLDRNLANTRPLQVVSISDKHNHYQFAGDGSAAHPNLYNRDVFAFLPYQVNAKRFMIHYYVMTRDVMKDLPPEQFTVQIKGIKGSGASVTAYDPIKNRNVPVVVNGRGSDNLSLNLTATDYPYLLTIQEAP